MNPTLIKAIELILALGILVMIHELGHYTFSRIFGVWVEKFYLFFNPWLTIAKWKPGKYLKWFSHGSEMAVAGEDNPDEDKTSWRATEYGIGWLPLGGYCAISGMIDESMNTEAMKQPAKPHEFRSKPAWQRLLIMLGGVLFNFLLAIVIYAAIVYTVGEQYIRFTDATEGMKYCQGAHDVGFVDGDIPLMADDQPLDYLNFESINSILIAKQVTVLRNHKDTVNIALPKDFLDKIQKSAEDQESFMAYRVPVVIAQLQPGMGAEKAGLKAGDRLISVNGITAYNDNDFTDELMRHKGRNVTIEYERDGKTYTASNVAIDGDGMLGILRLPGIDIFKTTVKHYNLLQCIPRGIELGWDKLVSYTKSLKLIFTPAGAKSLGGFGTIGSIFPPTWDWMAFWELTAFISVILAVMNVLPIPALDGGHVLFLLYEIITRRQPSIKFMEKAQMVGMAILIALLVFANGNDIYRFFFK